MWRQTGQRMKANAARVAHLLKNVWEAFTLGFVLFTTNE
jgi:hypothetical protein